MILKEVLPPTVIEYDYNYGYIYDKSNSSVGQHVDMHPFVNIGENGLKRLVIIWEASLMDKMRGEDILTFKLECGYVLDCSVKSSEGLERFKKILKITCDFFSIYYQYLNIAHPIKLKDLEQYYTGLEHHFQVLSPLLYDL